MKELNSKDSGELAGSADDVVLLQELQRGVQTADIMIHHPPPAATGTSEKTSCLLMEGEHI